MRNTGTYRKKNWPENLKERECTEEPAVDE
jgi:hypothetical protein